jgi:aminoglycoside phosphotransferase (APT) family kinase protein
MQQEQLDTTDFMAIVEIVQTHPLFLDEIRQPCLLHGDLWTFNVLVKRGEGGPTITGILDADRAWWGDPMADWTMFIWARGDGAEMEWERSLFWQGYSQPEESKGAKFRANVYEAMHTGAALVWAKQQYSQIVQKGFDDLQEIVQILSSF